LPQLLACSQRLVQRRHAVQRSAAEQQKHPVRGRQLHLHQTQRQPLKQLRWRNEPPT
jgi:hypothetical protein